MSQKNGSILKTGWIRLKSLEDLGWMMLYMPGYMHLLGIEVPKVKDSI